MTVTGQHPLGLCEFATRFMIYIRLGNSSSQETVLPEVRYILIIKAELRSWHRTNLLPLTSPSTHGQKLIEFSLGAQWAAILQTMGIAVHHALGQKHRMISSTGVAMEQCHVIGDENDITRNLLIPTFPDVLDCGWWWVEKVPWVT